MLDWNGVTVVFLFSYQKYYSIFTQSVSFHIRLQAALPVFEQEQTKVFVIKRGQTMTEQP